MKISLSIIALAIVVIATNLTYETLNSKQKDESHPFAKEKVVKVVGKYETQFDGLGVQTGFLVQTNDGLDVVPFDKGSMAGSMAAPEYISVYWPKDSDRPIVTPGAVR